MMKQKVLFIVFFLYSVVSIGYCFGHHKSGFSYLIQTPDGQYWPAKLKLPTLPIGRLVIEIEAKSVSVDGGLFRKKNRDNCYYPLKIANGIILNIVENKNAETSLIDGFNMMSAPCVIIIENHKGTPIWCLKMGNNESTLQALDDSIDKSNFKFSIWDRSNLGVFEIGVIVAISIALWKYRQKIKKTVFNALHIEYDEEGKEQEEIEHEKGMLESSSTILL